ncbi:uncharacterized protein LOC115022373 [Cottoperca gobio]|uniref:Uncharacterized protein LOC115022373 n=1 Tax=Cottoperca gobio TaxID=56716 RepID=A0A6J2RGG6_COTGO|nr:uncharacterized protein LOC115022373 [Cottoperca gobio]
MSYQELSQIQKTTENCSFPTNLLNRVHQNVYTERESIPTMDKTMIVSQHLLVETELANSLRKLTLEERRLEVRKQMFVELREMEVNRRQKVALETLQQCKRDREEEEQEAERALQESMETARRQEFEQSQLKVERLQWQQVMLTSPTCSFSSLKKDQQSEPSSAELCRHKSAKVHPVNLPSDTKHKTLHNNWVGEKTIESVQAKDNSATYLLFAAKSNPKCEEQKPKVNKSLQWIQDRLKVGHWVDKYQHYADKEREKRTRNAEQHYESWIAFHQISSMSTYFY